MPLQRDPVPAEASLVELKAYLELLLQQVEDTIAQIEARLEAGGL